MLPLAALACSLLTGFSQKTEPPLAATRLPIEQNAEGSQTEDPYCNGAEMHPVGESVAETFEVPYEDVMRLYCDGYEFEDILLALETQAQSEVAAESILQMRDEGRTWNEIWKDLGLVE